MEKETIKFSIRQDGTVAEEVFGVIGNSCQDLTKTIEEKLGNVTYVELNQNTISKKMSHFSTIKTKIKNKPELIEALQLLQYVVEEDQELVNPLDHQHEKVQVDISIGNDIGFRLNNNGEYELVADIQTWKDPVPPQRFIDKVTQQYARMTVHNTVKEMGFQVEEEWEMDDNSIELVVTRWI